MSNKIFDRKMVISLATSCCLLFSFLIALTYFWLNYSKLDSALTFYEEAIEFQKIPKKIVIHDHNNGSLFSGRVINNCLTTDPMFRCVLFMSSSTHIDTSKVASISVDGKKTTDFLIKNYNYSTIISSGEYHFVIPKQKRKDSVYEIAQLAQKKEPINSDVAQQILNIDTEVSLTGTSSSSYVEKRIPFSTSSVKNNDLWQINIEYSCTDNARPEMIITDGNLPSSVIIFQQDLPCYYSNTSYFFFIKAGSNPSIFILRNRERQGVFSVLSAKIVSFGQTHQIYWGKNNIDPPSN